MVSMPMFPAAKFARGLGRAVILGEFFINYELDIDYALWGTQYLQEKKELDTTQLTMIYDSMTESCGMPMAWHGSMRLPHSPQCFCLQLLIPGYHVVEVIYSVWGTRFD